MQDLTQGRGLAAGKYVFEVSLLQQGMQFPLARLTETGEVSKKSETSLLNGPDTGSDLKSKVADVAGGLPKVDGTGKAADIAGRLPGANLKGKAKDFVQVGGTARISGQYSSRQGTLQQTPPNYVRAELDPTLRLGSIPLGMHVLLSTEHSPEHPINQVSFGFDAQQFRQGLYDKTLSKVGSLQKVGDPAQLAQLQSLKDRLLRRQFGDLDKIREQLADPDLRGQLAQVQALDPIKQAMEHPQFAAGRRQLDSLQSVYRIDSKEALSRACDTLPAETCHRMTRLYALQEDYGKLQSKKEELEEKHRQLRKFEAMAKRLQAAEQVNMGALLAEPGNLRKSMRTLGLQSLPDQLAGTIRTLSVGACYPFFSPLTLNGIRVDGLLVELNPAIFYAAYTRGVVERPNLDGNSLSPRLKRTLVAGKAGLGKPEASHVFLSMSHLIDAQDAVVLGDSSRLQPQENLVIGTDLQLSLFRRNFTLQASGAGAAHSWNAYGPTFADRDLLADLAKEVPWVPVKIWEKLPFSPNATSHADFAFQLGTQLRLFRQNTLLTGNYSYVDPGFMSLGVPTLVNDRVQYEGRVDQQLLKRQVRLSGYWRRNHDQLSGNPLSDAVPYFSGKAYRTDNESFGGIAFLQFRKLPFLRVQYAPWYQSADSTGLNVASRLVNVMSGYTLRLKKLMLTTTLGVMDQRATSSRNELQFSNRMYTLTQSVILPAGLTLNFNGSLVSPQVTAAGSTRITSGDLSAGWRFFKVVQNTAGGQLYQMTGQGTRWGFYWNLSFPISRYARFELRAQRNLFDAVGGGSYREVVGRGVLSVRL